MAKSGGDKAPAKHDKMLPNWEPGQSGNPAGRPKGARSKLGEAFIKDLAEHWKANGSEALAKTFEKDPGAYVRVVASLLPKDVAVSFDQSLADVMAAIDGKTRGVPD